MMIDGNCGLADQSPQLRSWAHRTCVDELEFDARYGRHDAFFCFSTQIKGLNQLRVYGRAVRLAADIVSGSLV